MQAFLKLEQANLFNAHVKRVKMNANDTRPRTEIRNDVVFFKRREFRQKDGIARKTIERFILYYFKPVDKKIFERFVFVEFHKF